jgi:signal transduction histidine kinase
MPYRTEVMALAEPWVLELLGKYAEAFDEASSNAVARERIGECIETLANALSLDLERAWKELHALRRAVMVTWRHQVAGDPAEPLDWFHHCVDSAAEAAAARLQARQRHLLEAIERLDCAAFASTGVDELLRRVLIVLVESSPRVDAAAIFLPRRDGFELRAHRGLSEAHAELLTACDFPRRVASMRTPIEWVESAIRSEAAQLLAADPPVRSIHGVPLRLEAGAFGAALACSCCDDISPWERSAFTSLVHHAATSLRARLGDGGERLRREVLPTDHGKAVSALAQVDLLAMVAHDLRGPLSAILISAGALEQRGGVDAFRQAQALRAIRRGIERMERMIRDLLDFASIQAGRLQLDKRNASVALMVAEVEATVAASANEKRVRLDVDVDADAECCVDVDRMEQVLTNLLGNAIKFSRPGDVVRIRGGTRDGEFFLDVFDTGPGISTEHLEHVFEPFWSGREHRAKGTGLGLYICKMIVDRHGGRIWIDSMPGAGTSVHVRLPQLGS